MATEDISRLKDPDTAEVSLVSRGANKKRIAFVKSEDGMQVEVQEVLKAVLEQEMTDEEEIEKLLKSKKVSKKGRSAVTAALRILNAFKDEIPDAVMKQIKILAQEEEEEEEEITAQEEEEETKQEEPYPTPEAKQEEEYEMPKKSLRKSDGSIDFTAIPDKLRPTLEALWKDRDSELVELRKSLKVEKDERLKREFIAKADKSYKNLPDNTKDLGVLLKDLNETDEALATRVESLLKKCNEQLGTSALYKELGTQRGIASTSAGGRMESLAKEIMRADPKLTKEQAIAKALQEEPSLYKDYLSERGGN